MNTNKVQEIYLKDYKKSCFEIPNINLEFFLYETYTIVVSTLDVTTSSIEPMILNGLNLETIAIAIDDEALTEKDYQIADDLLTIFNVKQNFSLKITTKIFPKENLSCEGLYFSDNMYCTQNEPEGFRRITWFLDRPDIMSSYTTYIEADKKLFPYLLSNGNKIDEGILEDGKHFATWQDPHKKPCYLFALVAGDFALSKDIFITKSGRKVSLEIFVDKKNSHKTNHAQESLKRAMKWDEEVFDLEYDLDIYMIVAVDAFNMGAMENKGLNIFNSMCVLADEASTTDDRFDIIEGIIGHEYFHNWTGNRITCRDWFQLTLKEGLTVFRDQLFSADMTDTTLQRIKDVESLKQRQFKEDKSLMAHPIQPQKYIQINNFYTATVYQKGAEVIRMLYTLLGREQFLQGMKQYISMYDGKAITTQDFIKAFELSSKRDLTQFSLWYTQVGTPKIKVSSCYNEELKSFKIVFKQAKEALVFPVRYTLLSSQGDVLKQDVLEVNKTEQEFVFENLLSKPIMSIFADFSSPVEYEYDLSLQEKQIIAKYDVNGYKRYEALQDLIKYEIQNIVLGKDFNIDIVQDIITKSLNEDLSKQYKALFLTTLSYKKLASTQESLDYTILFNATKTFYEKLCLKLYPVIKDSYNQLMSSYKEDKEHRALKNCLLTYLCKANYQETLPLLQEQLKSVNMTNQIAALSLISSKDTQAKKDALQQFYDKWQDDTLVLNQWFGIQSSCVEGNILQEVQELEKHSSFNAQNPNKIYALYGSFCNNKYHFHHPSNPAYSFIKEKILLIDKFNSNVASYLCSVFTQDTNLNAKQKALLKDTCKSILEHDVSKDVYEIIAKVVK